MHGYLLDSMYPRRGIALGVVGDVSLIEAAIAELERDEGTKVHLRPLPAKRGERRWRLKGDAARVILERAVATQRELLELVRDERVEEKSTLPDATTQVLGASDAERRTTHESRDLRLPAPRDLEGLVPSHEYRLLLLSTPPRDAVAVFGFADPLPPGESSAWFVADDPYDNECLVAATWVTDSERWEVISVLADGSRVTVPRGEGFERGAISGVASWDIGLLDHVEVTIPGEELLVLHPLAGTRSRDPCPTWCTSARRGG